MRISRALATVSLAASIGLAVAGCATAGSPGSGDPAAPQTVPPVVSPPADDVAVIGQGTVIDIDGDAGLCLGPVAESYPPQCFNAVPLVGWSWEGVDGSEQSGSVRWGTYAVQATYDGSALTVTEPPIMLALYDPMMPADPTGGRPGAGDPAMLEDLSTALQEAPSDDLLATWIEGDRLWISVRWDDGSLQRAFDDALGEDVVLVQSALQPVG